MNRSVIFQIHFASIVYAINVGSRLVSQLLWSAASAFLRWLWLPTAPSTEQRNAVALKPLLPCEWVSFPCTSVAAAGPQLRLGVGACESRWEQIEWRGRARRPQRQGALRKLRALEGPERRATARSDSHETFSSLSLLACVLLDLPITIV